MKGGGGEGGCRGKGPEGDSREESDPGAGRGCGRAGHLRPGMLGALVIRPTEGITRDSTGDVSVGPIAFGLDLAQEFGLPHLDSGQEVMRLT